MKNQPSQDETIKAAEENLFAYVRLFATHGENDYFEDRHALRFISEIGIPSMQSNSIYKMTLGGTGDADAGIRELVRPFSDRKLPVFLTTGPSSSPHDLAARLKKNGFTHAQTQRGMAINLNESSIAKVPAHGLNVKRVESPEELKAWLAIYADGFDYSRSLADFIFTRYRRLFIDGAPPALHYLAYCSGKPAATFTVFVTGKMAGLYNIITVPEARRRGIATALTLTALDKAKELGCGFATLQATPMGAPVYRAIGFREICAFDLYMKLHGKSCIGFPAAFVGKKISNSLRGLRRI
ncbi:MAG: GNAT family N-acetyltransferase [Spirochaetes bacterium]|nr:MAG: GNAT family N-acetyltransferase [Spirochaetota bacterium]